MSPKLILSSLITAASLNLALPSFGALPHPDDMGKQGEHLALLAIVNESQASYVAVASGNWSNAATWGGTIPGDLASVVIPQGITVTIDTTLTPRFKWIRVNGVLNFATNVNTLLKVDTIVIDPVGSFVMGTAAQPISANVTAKIVYADFGEIDRSWDPLGLSRGLICHGSARIAGAFTTPYAILSAPARMGDTQLTLAAPPQNWKVGGRLVLPSVGFIYEGSDGLYTDDDENLTITAISGNVVTLNRPLKYNHLSPTGSGTIPIPLAYLDRNVTITSENFEVSRRGHNMFMHNWDVQVSDVLIEQCGRTDSTRRVTDPQTDSLGRLIPETTGNDRGRYALHFHRTVPDPNKPVQVKRVCIVNSPKLGFVNHDSNVIVEDSVAYDVAGSAFFTEVGSEIGAFRRNLAIRTIRGANAPRGDVEHDGADGIGAAPLLPGGPDFGGNGNGFWFQGAGIEVTDNMAFKSRDMGFVYDTLGIVMGGVETMFLRSNLTPDNPYYDPNKTGATIRVNQVPLKKFSGNIAAGAFAGFMLRKNDPLGKASVMENSKAVNLSDFGIDAEYGGPKTFLNLVILGGTLRGDGSKSGWLNGLAQVGFVSNQNSIGLTIKNCEISGFMRGLRFTVRGDNYIGDSTFDNITNLRIENGPSTDRPTIVERVTFKHTTPVLPWSDDFDINTNHDVRVYQPFGPTQPVTVNGVSLAWPGVEGGSSYYDIASVPGNPNPVAPAEPALQSAVSRKTHGNAGDFDLSLPLAGEAGVESRRNGSSLTLVLTFDKNVASGSASVAAGTGTVNSTSFTGNQMTINLAGVTDRQNLTVGVSNVTSSDGGILAGASVLVSMFYGDVTGDRSINIADTATTKLRSSPGTVTANTFKSDINADGAINIFDVTVVKLNAGASLQ